MEKTEGQNKHLCMTEDEILIVERIVEKMSHYIKNMKKSFYQSKLKVPSDNAKANFALHQTAFIKFGEQALEYSDLQLPAVFQFEDQPRPSSH